MTTTRTKKAPTPVFDRKITSTLVGQFETGVRGFVKLWDNTLMDGIDE